MKHFLLIISFVLQIILQDFALAGTQAIIKADITEGQETVTNFLKEKGHFEKNKNGVLAYADSAQRLPINGTGGSPTITCTRTTSNPIFGEGSLLITKDAANRQGEGCAIQFTIDSGYKAKMLQIEMNYKVGSGTFVAGSNSVDSDLIVYMYDVSNSTLIEPTTIKFYSSSTTLADKFVANFQTSATGTTYNLIIHQATTSASAYTVLFDQLEVKPSKYVYGTPISDWVSFGCSSSMVNVNCSGFYRRVGDTAEINQRMGVTGAPSGTWGPTFPAGVVPDSTKLVINNTALGIAWGVTGASNQRWTGTVVYVGTSNPVILGPSSAGGWTQSIPNTFQSGDEVYVDYKIPVVGWASTSQISTGFESRRIVLNVGLTSSQAVATNAVLKYDTIVEDTISGYSTATGLYTVQSAGTYRISAVSLSGANANMYVKINGTNQGVLFTALTTAASSGSMTYPCKAGDTIGIYNDNGGTFPAVGSLGFNNRLTIEKIQEPTTLSATEKVSFMAEGASSSTIGTNTVIPFNTPIEDTHAGWNSTNKDYTVPYPGTYKVNCQLRVTSGGGVAVNQYIDMIVQIDTVTKREGVKYVENASVAGWTAPISWQGPLIAGQKIRCVGDTNIGSPSLTTGSNHTYMEIFRVK